MSKASKAVLTEYKVLAKCDEPVKSSVLVLPAATTFGDLKAAVAKAFDMKPDVIALYNFYGVAFGFDIVHFGLKGQTPAAAASGDVKSAPAPAAVTVSPAVTDSEVLVESGLRDKSVLFVRAPLSIKPSIERKSKKQREREAAEANSFDPDRFAGISASNVLSKLVETKSDDKKRRVLIEFIETFTSDVFKLKSEFGALSVELVSAILKSDKLSVKEIDVFEAALGWGKEELKRLEKAASNSTDAKADLKTAMAKVVPLIRFPAMDMSDVATKVTGSQLLSQEQTLALYTYIGMRPATGSGGGSDKKSPPLPASLSMFNVKPRTGSTKLPLWDGTAHFTYNLYAISNNDHTASRQNSDGSIYILREKEFRTKGIHTIRVRCDTVGRNDNYGNDAIGFANENYPWTNGTLQSYGSCFINPTGGQFYVDSTVRQSGVVNVQSGTVLTFVLDCNKKTVTVSATTKSNTSEPVKMDWGGASDRIYMALCHRYTGWVWTVLE